jgi:putative ATP-dependent endonuclease of OLD family
MRLTKITIWNYRSFWNYNHTTPAAELVLGPGVNYLSGANNVGKSNILRALAFALDSDGPYDYDVDRPQVNTKHDGPAVELEFRVGSNPSAPVIRLLDLVDKYERTMPDFQEPSLAHDGILLYHAQQFYEGSRRAHFRTRGSFGDGGRKSQKARMSAIECFHEVVRFVDIKSGEDLQSLLQRGFRQILGSAVADENRDRMRAAETARKIYIDALGQLLRPIARHAEDRIKRYVSDIQQVDLQANVPSIEDAIADAQFILEDAFFTPLAQKGTGVRGAMLLLLLSFIAESAKTAVVFGIEEPEAFLHPDAHRALGQGLERFTQQDDVTLLVTTHSPFLFRSDTAPERGTLFRVTKDASGRSSVTPATPKDIRADLFGPSELPDILEKVEKVPADARLLLVVEGETDKNYLELAGHHLGLSLKGIHILPRGGAAGAVLEAVALAARHAPGRAVVALFDTDEPGAKSAKLLREDFRWKKKQDERLYVLTYDQWIEPCGKPVEAEDMFSNATIEAFFNLPENAKPQPERLWREKTQTWHYRFVGKKKVDFLDWLRATATPDTFKTFRPLLDQLRDLAKGT